MKLITPAVADLIGQAQQAPSKVEMCLEQPDWLHFMISIVQFHNLKDMLISAKAGLHGIIKTAMATNKLGSLVFSEVLYTGTSTLPPLILPQPFHGTGKFQRT